MTQKGSVLVGVLFLIAFVLLLGVPVLQAATVGLKASINNQVEMQAFYLAEAGVVHCNSLARALLQTKNLYAWLPEQFSLDPAPKDLLGVVLPAGTYGPGLYQATAHLEKTADSYSVRIVSIGTAGGSRAISKAVEARFVLTVSGGGGEPIPFAGGWYDGQYYLQVPAPVNLPPMGDLPVNYGSEPITSDGAYEQVSAVNGADLNIAVESGQIRTLVFADLIMNNLSTLQVDGGGIVNIFLENLPDIGTKVVIGDTSSGQVSIIYGGTGTLEIDTHAELANVLIYAPNATVYLKTDVVVRGAVVAKTIELGPHASIIPWPVMLALPLTEIFGPPVWGSR